MDLFADTLSILKGKIAEEQKLVTTVIGVIDEIVGIKIIASQIIFKKGLLVCNVPATVKMAIRLKESQILARCNELNIPVHTIA